MLAALGLTMVLLVFALGMGVLVLTFRGARRSGQGPQPARREPPPGPLPPKHGRGPSGQGPQPRGLVRQVADADIELEIRSGRVVNAIQLYREKTGVGPQEARSAVEAWRSRLTAS